MMKNSADELEKLKNELKDLLHEVGWTQKRLAEEIANQKSYSGDYHEEDYGNKNEYEKLKKALQRETTKPIILQNYIDFIIFHRENRNQNFIKLPELDCSDFPDEMKKILKDIELVSKEFFEKKK